MNNQFSWHNKSGDFAEKYLRTKFFPSIGLRFRKIPKGTHKKPDGWILQDKEKIAVAEIKLIKSVKRNGSEVARITIDKTIQRAIRSAKKQLKDYNTHLPKVIYLILDDHFADSRSVVDAMFGPWITEIKNGKTVYDGHRSFNKNTRAKQDKRVFGGWLSAIFCYKPSTRKGNLLLFKPQNNNDIPSVLVPPEILQEMWEYSETSLIKISPILKILIPY